MRRNPCHARDEIKTMWSSGATVLAILLIFVQPALGECVLTREPAYQLKSDTVDWTMQIGSGQSCLRGLRHGRVTIESAKLISAPQSGQVKLLGSGFSYTTKADFQGGDAFTIQVSGMADRARGSSDIRINVSVAPGAAPVNVSVAPGAVPTGFPNASNTGPVPGTVFQDFSGVYYVKTAGAVVNGLRGKGVIVVQAPNVTIQNCEVNASGEIYGIWAQEGTGVKVKNCRVYGDGLGGHNASHILVAIEGADEIAFNDIYGADNALSCGSCYIHDNYIHDFSVYFANDYHSDGVQTYGNAGKGGLRINHNTIIGIATMGEATPTNWAGASSAIALSEGMHDLVIDTNLFAGGSYTLYGPSQAGAAPANVHVTNNRFSTKYYPKVGAFGTHHGFNSNAPGFQWSGNVIHETGQAVNP
jgi:Right handed beta helix region